MLKSRNLTLCGVLETHFHADFVSGHYELGQRVGAPIYFGPSAAERCKYPVHELKDNEVQNGTNNRQTDTIDQMGMSEPVM